MSHYAYRGQSLLDIELDTQEDLQSATAMKMVYVKPNNGGRGEWTDVTKDGTKMVYAVKPGDIDVSGMWSFQAVFTINGRVGIGDVHHEYFAEPL